MAGVSLERPPAAPNPGANTERSAEIARQGQVGNRRVSTSGGGSVGPMRREHINNAAVATPISERSVGLVPDDPTRLPISWFAEQLSIDSALDGMHQDTFPLSLQVKKPSSFRNDARKVLHFAKEIDRDIVRASELLEKSEQKPLNEQEQREVKTLLGAGKYNLAQVQHWTAAVKNALEKKNNASYAGQVASVLGKLQERLADRHMDLADLMCLYDLDQAPSEQTVGPVDRIDHSLVINSAALKVVRGLTVSGLSADAKQQLVAVLETGHAKLIEGRHAVAVAAEGKVLVVSKANWESAFDLTDFKHDVEWLPPDLPKTEEQVVREGVRHRLRKAGVTEENLPDLKFQFKEAINQIRNKSPWKPVEKQLHYTVAGEEYTVHSKITPAKAMVGAEHFAEDIPANGVCGGDRMQYTHVPNLARTELTDASGTTLFSALRHGVLDAYDISASTLRKLPEQELSTIVEDLLVPHTTDERAVEQRVNQVADEIRTDPTQAAKYASDMRTAASANMAKELAVAALVGDPDKLQMALAGEAVDLTLSSVSLLTPDRVRSGPAAQSDERAMLRRQTEALKQLDSGVPTSLQVRDDTSESRTVKANCKVRTFNFGVNAGAVGRAKHMPSQVRDWDKLMGWSYAVERNNPELRTLLGDPRLDTLGGDVADKLHALEREQLRLGNRLKGAQASLQRNPWVAEKLGPKISECERDIAATTRSITTLGEAATATKQLWREGGDTKSGENPYKLVSHLSMVINEMGETLAFNCKSGQDRSGQLDAELKYSTALNAAEGHLPDSGAPVSPQLRQMRSDFSLNSGNLEMQRMNAGLPGFEQDSKEVPGLATATATAIASPVELKISDQITYLDKVSNSCPEQCAVFAANHFKLECKFDDYKHDDQIDITYPLGFLAPDATADIPRLFIDGKTEESSLKYLLKLDKSAIYLMRTGQQGLAGHNQMLYSKDNEWFAHDTPTRQHQLTLNGSLTAAGRDRMVKPYATWGTEAGQASIFVVQTTKRSTSAMIDFIKDCRKEGDTVIDGRTVADRNFFTNYL